MQSKPLLQIVYEGELLNLYFSMMNGDSHSEASRQHTNDSTRPNEQRIAYLQPGTNVTNKQQRYHLQRFPCLLPDLPVVTPLNIKLLPERVWRRFIWYAHI